MVNKSHLRIRWTNKCSSIVLCLQAVYQPSARANLVQMISLHASSKFWQRQVLWNLPFMRTYHCLAEYDIVPKIALLRLLRLYLFCFGKQVRYLILNPDQRNWVMFKACTRTRFRDSRECRATMRCCICWISTGHSYTCCSSCWSYHHRGCTNVYTNTSEGCLRYRL